MKLASPDITETKNHPKQPSPAFARREGSEPKRAGRGLAAMFLQPLLEPRVFAVLI